MKRSIAILAALLLTLIFVGDMHFYGSERTANAGVWWSLGHHWCGYEFRGHPGFFCDVS